MIGCQFFYYKKKIDLIGVGLKVWILIDSRYWERSTGNIYIYIHLSFIYWFSEKYMIEKLLMLIRPDQKVKLNTNDVESMFFIYG